MSSSPSPPPCRLGTPQSSRARRGDLLGGDHKNITYIMNVWIKLFFGTTLGVSGPVRHRGLVQELPALARVLEELHVARMPGARRDVDGTFERTGDRGEFPCYFLFEGKDTSDGGAGGG